MAELAVTPRMVHSSAIPRRRLQIQKPEISTYQPAAVSQTRSSVSVGWKMLVALTYLFSLITFYFVFTV